MAIQPDIALSAGANVPPVDVAGTLQKAATLRNLMTANEYQPAILQQKLSTEASAQRATDLANEQATRELDAKKRLADIMRSNSSVDAKSGVISVDYGTATKQAASEGYDVGTVLGLADKAATTAQNQIKTADDARKFAESVYAPVDNLLRVQTDPLKAAQTAHGAIEVVSKAIGQEAARSLASKYWSVPEQPPVDPQTGQVDVAGVGAHLIKQAQTNSKAGISPQQAISNAQTQESLAQGRESLAQGGAAGVTSPEARDPTSQISQQAQEDYLAANPTADRGRVKRLSAANLQHLSTTSNLTASVIPTAGERVAAKGAEAKTGGDVDVIDAGLKALPSLQQNFGSKFGSMSQDAYNRLVTQNPALGSADAAITAYNLRNGTNLSLRTDGAAAVQNALTTERSRLSRVSQAQGEVATSPTLKTGQQPTMRKTGDIIKRNGKTYLYTGKTSALGTGDAANSANYKEQ